MPTATSILEQEYFLEFPISVRKKANIHIGDCFYAYRGAQQMLVLSRVRPSKSKYCNVVEFHVAHGAILPHGFLHRMRIRPGDMLELTAENDKITIQKGVAVPLFPSGSRRGALEIKLKRELATPPKFFSQSFREDVYSVLALTEWSEDFMLRLIQTPDLLQEVMRSLHNDDVFSTLFEQRVKDLTLELVENDVKIMQAFEAGQRAAKEGHTVKLPELE